MKWCAQGHAPAGPHQRRHARADRQRRRVRRRRHRPLPHRAHVLRGRPHRRHARDDPGRQHWKTAKRRWPSCCPISATISSASSSALEGLAGHHPLPRSAVARIPAARRSRQTDLGRQDRRVRSRKSRSASSELHEFNPMLGLRGCRLGIVFPGNHRNAGARHLRGRRRSAEERHQGQAGNHDSARRFQEGTGIASRDRPPRRRRGGRRRRK